MGSPSVPSLRSRPDPELVQKSWSTERSALQASRQPVSLGHTMPPSRQRSLQCLSWEQGRKSSGYSHVSGRDSSSHFPGNLSLCQPLPLEQRSPNIRDLICHPSPVASTFGWLFVRNAHFGHEPFEDGANYPSVEFGFKLPVPLAVSKL